MAPSTKLLPGSTVPDFSRPVRQLQTGETFDPNHPTSTQTATPYATPDAATIKRGEDLENREAQEAQEKSQHASDPANQIKADQEKIEDSIKQDQEKIEGSN